MSFALRLVVCVNVLRPHALVCASNPFLLQLPSVILHRPRPHILSYWCTTQNYCQVLLVTMTRRTMSEWNVSYASRTMTLTLRTHTHTHTDAHTHVSSGTFITQLNDVGGSVAVAQIFVDNGCENWRRVIAFGLTMQTLATKGGQNNGSALSWALLCKSR